MGWRGICEHVEGATATATGTTTTAPTRGSSSSSSSGSGSGSGMSLFHIAAKWGSVECMQLLLQCWQQYRNISPPPQPAAEISPILSQKLEKKLGNMWDGTSPLHLAARYGHAAIITQLLAPTPMNMPMPMPMPVLNTHPHPYSFCDVFHQDFAGNTACAIAIKWNRQQCIEILAQAAASASASASAAASAGGGDSGNGNGSTGEPSLHTHKKQRL